jgi:hypothetical protein
MITPHKIPARIALIRQLASKNEQLLALNSQSAAKLNSENKRLLALNSELAAKLDELNKRSAMDRPLVFMHVPKTSGTALTAGLREVLPSTACLVGFDRWLFGAFRSFETISPELHQLIYETLPPANGIDFVAGHIAYSTLVQGRPAARFMTVLREPRSRILSQWMFTRSFSDETLRPWGVAWGRVIRRAREPLVEYLNHREVAHSTDNIAVRMLLWPHPLIPDDGFIDSASDKRLASEAAARLKAFDFVDVIENPRLEDNVRAFLARPFVYRRVNETVVRSEIRVPLEEELTGEALLLVEHRSRLDRELWRTVAAERIAGADLTALSDDTFHRIVTRFMRPFVAG